MRKSLHLVVVLISDLEGGLINLGNLCQPNAYYCKEWRENFSLIIDGILTYGNNYNDFEGCDPE